MTIVRLITTGLTALLLILVVSCSSQKEEIAGVDDAADSTVRDYIQEAFNESAARWRLGDKAALYDMEFEYYQDQYSYDDYLAHPTIRDLVADTLESLIVLSLVQFGEDSAHVDAEAVLVGPTGVRTRFNEGIPYRFYFHRERWIYATISSMNGQLEYEELIRASNAAAEEESEFEDE